ncbi:type IV secretory system conjugative DNA transfer family protein [Photobacterium leiognathi]|uniref:hypothetical protein n=1 Tax=Photobacterium leiognathi TaxID=553611 RepID=UPI0029826782|nr:hypothetical protein [Photobacterium leiognathi]
MAGEIKGIDDNKKSNHKRTKDIRTFSEKLNDYGIGKSLLAPISLSTGALIAPQFSDLYLAISVALCPILINKRPTTVVEAPKSSSKYGKGDYFFGNEINTGREIWYTDSVVRTHGLYLGCTGSGKSETLQGLASNAMAVGGLIYCDGKGDAGLAVRQYAIARRFGRDDHFLLLNFMTASANLKLRTEQRRSHTINPAGTLSEPALVELLISLMPDKGSGDAIWGERAGTFISGLLKILVYMRDEGKLLLDVSTIRTYFTLDRIIELSERDDIPMRYRESLISFIRSLAGYQEGKEEQSSQVHDQFGFVVMQFTSVMSMLSDSFRHLFVCRQAEVNIFSVVKQRLILIVLLPALEKSSQSISNCGKIILSLQKGMMAYANDSEIEGETQYTTEARSTKGRTFFCIYDEFGYYNPSSGNTAVIPAQARSIGISANFCSQDAPSLYKSNKEDAKSIIANCALKTTLLMEDPEDSMDIFIKAAGKEEEAKVSSMKKVKGLFSSGYSDDESISFELKDRISGRDLKAQEPGEFTQLYRDKIIRGNSFFANPEIPFDVELIKFISVPPPDDEERESLFTGMREIKKAFAMSFNEDFDLDSKITRLFNDEIVDDIELHNYLHYSKKSNLLKRCFGSIAMYSKQIEIIDNKIVSLLNPDQIPDFDENLNFEQMFNEIDQQSSNSFSNDGMIELAMSHSPIAEVQRQVEKNKRKLHGEFSDELIKSLDIDLDDLIDKMAEIESGIVSTLKSLSLANEMEKSEGYAEVSAERDVYNLVSSLVKPEETEKNNEVNKNNILKLLDELDLGE